MQIEIIFQEILILSIIVVVGIIASKSSVITLEAKDLLNRSYSTLHSL
jgi:predicted permease